MEQREFVRLLLEFVPNSPSKFRNSNQQVLDGWLTGSAKTDDIGRLLVGWSVDDTAAKMTSAQRDALVAALVSYTQTSAESPRSNAYFAVRAVANNGVALPWQDATFLAHVIQVINSAPDNVVGAGRRVVADALLRIRDRQDIPVDARDHAGSAFVKISPPTGPSRTSPPTASPSRLGVADIPTVCKALRVLAQRYLDRNRRESNERMIRLAEESPTGMNLAELDFLMCLMFGAMHRRYGGSIARIDASELHSASIAAAYLASRPLIPNTNTRQGVAFAVLVLSMIELDERSVTPADVADRITSKRWIAAFEDAQGAREAIIRFGNDYMQRQKVRRELDANGAIAWLKLYQQVLNEAGGTIEVTLREPLLAAIAVTSDFEKDDTVSFLITMIDPRRAKHPWTAPEALPFLTSDTCATLEADLRALRLPKIRALLADATVVDSAKRYLESILADDAYDNFRAPVQTVRPFRPRQRPAVADARREYEASNPTNRRVYHLYRQWYAYSLTGDGGDILMAKRLWEETEEKYRTYEERWNLAVVYNRIGQERRALELLWDPGLKNADAPYDHLKFASLLSLRITDFSGATDLLRLLPLAAGHIIAYAATPPSDTDREIEYFTLIRSLASEPLVSTLDTYPDPRAMRRDLRPFLDALRKKLVELKLKNTWRVWLTGFLNQYPTSIVAWEMLYQSWTNDDSKRGQEALDRALITHERWRGLSPQDLISFARLYIQFSDDSRSTFGLGVRRVASSRLTRVMSATNRSQVSILPKMVRAMSGLPGTFWVSRSITGAMARSKAIASAARSKASWRKPRFVLLGVSACQL